MNTFRYGWFDDRVPDNQVRRLEAKVRYDPVIEGLTVLTTVLVLDPG